jgi:putative endonuclease
LWPNAGDFASDEPLRTIPSWPGLSRPSTECIVAMMRWAIVYIVTNRPNGVLYIGVTTDIARRAYEHREGLMEGFTKRYGLTRIVFVERHQSIAAAIQRERNMKHWPRAWKVWLILASNPTWDDLSAALL